MNITYLYFKNFLQISLLADPSSVSDLESPSRKQPRFEHQGDQRPDQNLQNSGISRSGDLQGSRLRLHPTLEL